MRRNRRAAVEDRWTKTVHDDGGGTRTVPSARHGRGLRWMARYVDGGGREHTKAFGRKVDAQAWLDTIISAQVNRHLCRSGAGQGHLRQLLSGLVGAAGVGVGHPGTRWTSPRSRSRSAPWH